MSGQEGRTVPAEILANVLDVFEGQPTTWAATQWSAVVRAREALNVAQPPPSVPAGADVAAVLRELIELEDSAAGGSTFSGRYIKLRERALEALAATGTRAAGGGNPPCGEPLGPHAKCRCYGLGYCYCGSGKSLWQCCTSCAGVGAPPTPSVPGVAELLAECRRRQELWPISARFTPDEIVRMLAPDGADGGNGS